ncbi:MAG: response regulator [Nitrospirae bacterium]|nr:response regulator [Nitrospirota bacterium]
MPKKLLLADDSITIQKVVELILSEEDFEIITVGDGQEALSKLKNSKPDIILADIDMPKIDGYDLCKEIKSNPATKHIPVILLVGAFEPINEQKAKEVGSDDFLIKPFESHEFLKKIHSVLQRTPSTSKAAAKEEPADVKNAASDLEPLELGDSSMIDEEDMQALLEETMVEETAAFEEEHQGTDEADDNNFADDDLTTKELQNIIETLKEPGGQDQDDAEVDVEKVLGSFLEETIVDKSDEQNTDGDIQNVLDNINENFVNDNVDTNTFKELMNNIANEMIDSEEQEDGIAVTSMLEDIGDKLNKADIEPVEETVFREEEYIHNMVDSLRTIEDVTPVDEHIDTPPLDNIINEPLPKKPSARNKYVSEEEEVEPKPLQNRNAIQEPAYKEADYRTIEHNRYDSEQPPPAGGVLISMNDVVGMLKRHVDDKVSGLIKEGDLYSLFESAINTYVDLKFRDMSISFDDIITEAINKRIDKLIGQINIETIINQVISSTIRGIMVTLTGEMFKTTKEVTERLTKQVLEENIPLLKSEIEKVTYEAVTTTAERLIKNEIEQIRSEFL